MGFSGKVEFVAERFKGKCRSIFKAPLNVIHCSQVLRDAFELHGSDFTEKKGFKKENGGRPVYFEQEYLVFMPFF